MNQPTDGRLLSDRFPRSNAYHPDWVIEGSMGSHVLWLTEWLTDDMNLQPGMRVLDLGCGKALSSVFLAREFDVQVWAADLWVAASVNGQRIGDLGLADQVFPLHCDAHSLPFASEFFDAIVCMDAFSYFGTNDLYLNYLVNFLKPGGQLGMAGAGLIQEFSDVPDYLSQMWTSDFVCLHSADWWRQHWQRSGAVDLQRCDTMPDGWRAWQEWQSTAHPENKVEIDAVEADRGRLLGYVRAIATRREGVELVDYCWPDTMRTFPIEYEQKPLLREST